LPASESAIVPNYELLDPDVRLMLQVRDGSAAAMEQLVTKYQARLLTVLEHLVNNRELAEDLAQEVFLRVFRARHSYTAGAKFSTWLFTIANNIASNARRDRARRKEVRVNPAPPNESGAVALDQMALAASGLMPTRQLDRAEMAEVVRLAIENLSERQRLAVLLSKFEEMSYADIAATMGMSPQAIKSLLSRARGNLRTILEPYLQTGVKPTVAAVESEED
jgi:RNA polymerase sigma-70 factor (ECF subfamily)